MTFRSQVTVLCNVCIGYVADSSNKLECIRPTE